MTDTGNIPHIPRRRGISARQVIIGSMALIVALIVTLFRGASVFYTDFLWFQSVHLTSVWSGVLQAKIFLAVGATVFMAALLWVNIWVADHWAPRSITLEPDEDLVRRYKEFTHGHQTRYRTIVAVVLGLLGGVGFYSHWREWLMFINGGSFGINDPQFHRDIGFFVFKLPFLVTLTDALMVALIFTLIVSIAAHYLQGAIPIGRPHARITSAVKIHVSVLAGLLALLQGIRYYLDRFQLSYSTRGVTPGANYTDVHFLMPALILLALISVVAAVVFFASMRQRSWSIPVLTLVLWVVVSILVGAIIPAGVQKLAVEPSESQKERPYIQRNIDATRAAIGLQNIQVHDFPYSNDLNAKDLADNAQTIRNIRLWSPATLIPSYQRLQETRSFFKFADVDVDRYQLNDEETQMMLSVRELNTSQLPAGRTSWVNEHLQYTHGYGAVASPANAVTSNGAPDFTLKDVPPVGSPDLKVPQVYFGEYRSAADYSIVATGQPEVDYVATSGQDQTSSYQGSGGVPLNNVVKKIAFATRVGDINPLISNLVGSNARALYETNINERAKLAAPFLSFDDDPYPVVIDGRIFWVQDAYTTTSGYPYASPANTSLLNTGSDLRGDNFNYIRNSVKVVTDAYNGNMTFYVVDHNDPVIKAWQKSFPKLFTDGSQMSDEMRNHLRYPEDLFRVQTTAYGRYHMTQAIDFYSGSDRWNIAQDPTKTPSSASTTPSTVLANGNVVSGQEARIAPYYLLMRLPGDASPEFLMFQPFVPYSQNDERKELSAFMTVKSDPSQYGRMDAYVMPRDQQIDGPALVDARIQQEPNISRQISLLNQQGSSVRFGDMLIIPIENSLLYVRPMYVTARQTNVPEFKAAIVVSGSKISMQPTLQAALTDVFGTAPATLEQGNTSTTTPNDGSTTTPTTQPPSSNTTNSPEVQALLDQANSEFAQADEALRNGDLAAYQQHVKAGVALVQQARSKS